MKLMEHPAPYCCVGISLSLSRGFKSSQPSHKELTVAAARQLAQLNSSQMKASSIVQAFESIGKRLGTSNQNFLNFIYMLYGFIWS